MTKTIYESNIDICRNLNNNNKSVIYNKSFIHIYMYINGQENSSNFLPHEIYGKVRSTLPTTMKI